MRQGPTVVFISAASAKAKRLHDGGLVADCNVALRGRNHEAVLSSGIVRPRTAHSAGTLVPALVTATHGTITETPVVLSYIADVTTDHALLPAIGTSERYEALRWMAYISSTVHPAFGRLWRAARFCDDADCERSVERSAAAQLADDYAYIDKHMSNRRWVAGDNLTVADFHLFVFGRLGLRVAPSTRDFPGFHRHTMEIASLPAVKSAMAQQGIAFEVPATGPG